MADITPIRKDVTIHAPPAIGRLALGSAYKSPVTAEATDLADLAAYQADTIRELQDELAKQQSVNTTLAKACTALVRDIQRRDQVDEIVLPKREWFEAGWVTVGMRGNDNMVLKISHRIDQAEWDEGRPT